jgi:hypothetical protein
MEIFHEHRYILVEPPSAKTWDDENRQYFRNLGFETEVSATMYTSVHYVVQPNSRTELTCEIQVRTLMEEVWGEVDHLINYPKAADSLSCREQIKVLARVTSSASRLVDSIFLTHDEANVAGWPSDGKKGGRARNSETSVRSTAGKRAKK